MLIELNLAEFTRRLGDGEPTPGGGSASALAGAMGAALVAMFCNLTASRKKYAAVQQEMEAAAAFALAKKEKLLALVDLDSAAYNKIVAANRLPRESEAEKSLRQQALETATAEATRTPLETVSVTTELLTRLPTLAVKGNPNALSDLKVGIELLNTAFLGAKANVEINLPWLPEPLKGELAAELQALTTKGNALIAALREEIAAVGA